MIIILWVKMYCKKNVFKIGVRELGIVIEIYKCAKTFQGRGRRLTID
jgi:hypothetical protein